MKKRFFAAFLAVLTVLTAIVAVPVSAETSGDWNYEITDGNVTITRYTGHDTDVTIPDKIDGYPVTAIGFSAFLGTSAIENITIPDSVTSIGVCAFTDCISLKSITIPDGVTSIGKEAFYNCTSLESITLPKGVTSIDEGAFFYCSALNEIAVADGNPNYASVDGVLYDKSVTTLITSPGAKTSVTVPEGVTAIGPSAFFCCTSLESVTIPDSVTTIGVRAFTNCLSLKSITIPTGVTAIGNSAFSDCSALTEITVAGGNSNFASVDGVLYDKSVTTLVTCPCAKTRITIPESVTAIGDGAFYGCSVLNTVCYGGSEEDWKKIQISSNNEDLLDENIIFNSAISGDGNWEYLIADGNVTVTRYTGQDTDVTIPDTIDGYPVTAIGDGAFRDCSALENIIISNGVTAIGWGAFQGCSALESVTIPGTVTSIGVEAFSDCSALTEITVAGDNPNYASVDGVLYDKSVTTLITCPDAKTSVNIPESVTAIGVKAFHGCSALTGITIPESVTAIGDGAFFGCSALTEIVIPDGVTAIGYLAFYRCSALESITIPDSVTAINGEAFYRCSALKSITIPAGVTTIGQAAFGKCSALESVTIPDTVTEIGWGAFQGCSALTGITIPGTVTSIGVDAFSDCSALTEITVAGDNPNYASVDGVLYNKSVSTLITCPDAKTSVTIPESVTAIGEGAFSGCSALNTVRYCGSEDDWSKIQIDQFNDKLLNVNFIFNFDPTVLPGDPNGDGKLNAKDISAIMKHILGNTPADFINAAADMNGDGKINAKDITAIMAEILKK